MKYDGVFNGFTTLMPPPNVTGELHLGHALVYVLQDISTRVAKMHGRPALMQPGLDHAGIATQMLVMKNLGVSNSISKEELLEKIWAWSKDSGDKILKQMSMLDISADWDKIMFTLDENVSKAVSHAFVELYKDGLIERRGGLVNWDPVLETALSDLEVDHCDEKGSMWDISYKISGTNEVITVSTTRPETLFGDTAIAVHPNDERYAHLVGKSAIVPIVGREIPVISDEYCDMEKGTGAVKITPAHDFNDYDVGMRHNLPMLSIFDKKARMVNVPDPWNGRDRFEARKMVVNYLQENGFLAYVRDVVHKVPYSQRSLAPIEPSMMQQWYLNTDSLAKMALDAVELGQTSLISDEWAEDYRRWLTNPRPW